MPNKFAPIYDSGSCLGRELLDDRVVQMLGDEDLIYQYVEKGKSEIHWNNEKKSHFDLIKNILKKFPNEVKSEIK